MKPRVALLRTPVCLAVFALPLLAMADDGPAAKPPAPPAESPAASYAVVVSKKTAEDPGWKPVVEALRNKHQARLIVYESNPAEALGPLREAFPRYACFVAQPEEAGREFVVAVHRLARQLDDDPYTDVLWAILTGYSPKEAMRIVRTSAPLVIRKGAAGTGLNLDLFDEGCFYSEGQKGLFIEKRLGGKPEEKTCPDDSTRSIVETLNTFQPELFFTSGHATDRDWQIGFTYRNGQFRSKDGVLMGVDLKGQKWPVNSPNPKVYLPSGNCLMGLIRDRQSIALAWMGSAGVDQMIGYVVSTWYGRAGWGTRDWLFTDPGRRNLVEAFYFNNQKLMHDLLARFPKSANVGFAQFDIERDPRLIGMMAQALGYKEFNNDVKDNVGLLWDRDTLALYGDPAWDARLVTRPWHYDQKLSVEGGKNVFQVDALADGAPGLPPAMLLPHRVGDVEVLEGQQFEPLVTDNFIMVNKLGELAKGKTYRVVFRAKRLGTEK